MLLEKLKDHSGLSERQLDRYAATASNRYKVYTIPKKPFGVRTIEHPSREIKAIQRWLNSNIIRKLPVHSSATAYHRGASIKENAIRHAGSNFTLHVDFQNFFPSFHGHHIEKFLRWWSEENKINLNDNDISFFRKIVCRNNALTIGAPSSPILTNAMMFDFDGTVALWCTSNGFIYTRYADDIFISSVLPGKLGNALEFLKETCPSFPYANLSINHNKTAFLSRRYKRSITGLIITPERKISIGRAKKEEIKSEVYKFSKGELTSEEIGRLRGKIAFTRDVEPSFYDRLLNKYGYSTIHTLEFLGEGDLLGK
ncbi:retron St85 family RNA-directed DNA polymerase [Azospirillum sp. B4]|uniref:retron St85 family RNA-directed DNA polymerase n=1 Tax=Azospirillum sp. B4 TaxID=95605 RepID=UPI000A07672C|nr:retron St85 family RNA-directed DNA polymerase [Azospirillum sp. B4]